MSAATQIAPSTSSDSAPTRDCPEPTMSVSESGASDQNDLSQREAEELESRVIARLRVLRSQADVFCSDAYALAEALGWEGLQDSLRRAKREGSKLTTEDMWRDLHGSARVEKLNHAAELFGSASAEIETTIGLLREGKARAAHRELGFAQRKAEEADTAAGVVRNAVQRHHALRFMQSTRRRTERLIEEGEAEEVSRTKGRPVVEVYVPDLETEATKGVVAKGLTELVNVSFELLDDLEIEREKIQRLPDI